MNTEKEDLLEGTRYFLFCLGEELYGTPLLGIREVIEKQEIKPIPNTVEHFLGAINVRGQIVGVVDFRIKYGIPANTAAYNSLVVFNTVGGAMAALVDRVDSVVTIPNSNIDKQRSVHTKVNAEILVGIGVVGQRLVTLIELDKALAVEEISLPLSNYNIKEAIYR